MPRVSSPLDASHSAQAGRTFCSQDAPPGVHTTPAAPRGARALPSSCPTATALLAPRRPLFSSYARPCRQIRCRVPPSFSLGLKSRPTAPLHPRPPPLLTEDCLAPRTACLSVTCFEKPTLAYVVAVMGWPSSSPPEPAPTEADL